MMNLLVGGINIFDIIFRLAMSHYKIFVTGLFCFFFQLINASDYIYFLAIDTLPHRKRGPPVAFARYRPIFDFSEPFAKTPIANISRLPIYFFIFTNKLLFDFRVGHFYIPRIPRIIYERGMTTPAMWIRVLVFF